jgi:hypothetical protein
MMSLLGLVPEVLLSSVVFGASSGGEAIGAYVTGGLLCCWLMAVLGNVDQLRELLV